MSWQAMDAIDQLPYDACGPLAFRVLTKLANVAAQDGTRAWRLVYEIADELGVSTRSIQRATQELERANLIRKGDQRAVSHWQGNRRPIVWDIVMHPKSTQAPLPVDPDDDEFRGDTVIHSPDDTPSGVTPGVTPGATTAVAHRELRELREQPTKTPVRNHRADVTPETRSRCTGPSAVAGQHHFDELTGWCTNACGLRAPAPIGASA
ncbi:hypothetical protein DEJ16_12700 [Curtobacterium sp. MCJR17_055]|uniref:helix-turn-helix domain-containing protein n=2 Tax=Curtobacterium TaxID=2034 RepID=UPI000D9A45FF|nr:MULTISPECIES: helix-turn-helix domain-containing protein [unclassified Curtobacterium]PYY34109.1 hypothetical protein DEI87_10125 [Curtobacterium sp. MCBD17_029]PYY53959.1 hypothetical protein DEJ16_12700 [Curtobacterium sp. MCJR17_055]PYY59154.1 hypothetical protein DEJ26_09115 [Curtobacterium sp. MCPF17_015]